MIINGLKQLEAKVTKLLTHKSIEANLLLLTNISLKGTLYQSSIVYFQLFGTILAKITCLSVLSLMKVPDNFTKPFCFKDKA